MLSVDPYLNETTRHAHVILPPPSPLTRNHYDVALSRMAVRNHARWTPRLFQHEGPSEADILASLELIVSGRPASARTSEVFEALERQLIGAAAHANPELAERDPKELSGMLQATEPLDRCIEIMVRSGAYGDGFGAKPDGLTFQRLRDSPHGIDLGALQPALPHALRTPSGQVELMPALIRGDLERLTQALGDAPNADGYTLVGRRDLRSNNSWMHNLPLLVKGKPRCTLQLHPQDAARLGVVAGQGVRIQTEIGELVAPAELNEGIMPGVVSLPHGYGHDRPGTRQRVAKEHAGVNFNELVDAGQLDPLSGTAVLSGLRVSLTAVPAEA